MDEQNKRDDEIAIMLDAYRQFSLSAEQFLMADEDDGNLMRLWEAYHDLTKVIAGCEARLSYKHYLKLEGETNG